MLQRTFVFALVLAAIAAAGCVTVHPYQREWLARPSMDGSSEVGSAGFRSHVFDSREGATGGSSSTGGGCGCN